MFSFILTDEKSSLKVCKHCEDAFVAGRPNSVFCSGKCKNQYNVYKSRAKDRKKDFMNTDITKQMEMVLYRTEDDNVTVSALIKDETIWLTPKAMAELFGIDKLGISRYLAKIFETGELDEEVVVAKIATTTQHGAMQDKTQTTSANYYNLDAIISVGYRVNSIQATQFRIWATNKTLMVVRSFRTTS